LSYNKSSSIAKVKTWIDDYISKGCDLHELAIGLSVEHDQHYTYSSLQKMFKANDWTPPIPKPMGRYKVSGNGENGIMITVKDNGKKKVRYTGHTEIANIWKAIRQDVGEVFDYSSSIANDWKNSIHGVPAGTRLVKNVPVPPEDGHMDPHIQVATHIPTIVDSAVKRVLDELGVNTEFDRPPMQIDIDDIPDSCTMVALNDPHVPYHDPIAVTPVVQYIRDTQPNYVILNGDIIDCKPLSKYDTGRWGNFTLKQEINQTRKFLSTIRDAAPDAKIIYVPGNHEFRIAHYIRSNAPAAEGISDSLDQVLTLGEFDIELRDTEFRESYIKFDDFYIGHWDRATKNSGYTAKNLMGDMGVSFIQAHVHRVAIHCKTLMDRELIGIENGCLCQLDPHFKLKTDWQHGFSVITKIGSKYFPQVINITNGEFVHDGYLWKASKGRSKDGIY